MLIDTYSRFPLSISRGKGCWLWDTNGEKYLDAVAGIATCCLGHSDNALRRSLSKQLNKIQHVSNLYRIPQQEKLAKWLVEHSCADKVFFCNSGAEANEAAIKLVRKYAHVKQGVETPIILSAKGSFHGRTLATVSATGQPKYHKGFEPVVEGFEFFKYNDWDSFYSLINNLEAQKSCVSAIIIEPLQGEGGINPGEREFFLKLREECNSRNIILIFDEVQTGVGRTGKWWGYQQLGIEPDGFTLAKGLGGGHPIGALLVKDKINIFSPGDHASTFGGNPFACEASLTVLNQIEKRNIICNVNKRGEELKAGLIKLLTKYPKKIKEIRGWGLIQGIVLNIKSDRNAQDFVNIAIQEKLLLVAAGLDVVRLVPPLTIKKREINELLKRVEACIDKYNN